MEHVVLEKLDSMTPAHVLRSYPTREEAMLQAYRWAAARKPGEMYPQYIVDGRRF